MSIFKTITHLNSIPMLIKSEKMAARPMLFDSTNYWQQFSVQFVVYFNSHSMYFYLAGNYVMGNMALKLPCIRPYISYSVL